MKYTAIYGRQSAFRPDSESINLQIEKCKEKIPENVPVKIYDKDLGFSGSNTDRPSFTELVNDIKQGLIESVWVYKLDRISRSVADFSKILELFKNYDVSFNSATQTELSTSSDSAYSKFMLQIMSVFAELERDNIKARCTDSYYQRMSLSMLNGGQAPFGFQRVPTYIAGKKCDMYGELKEQADVVKYLYDEYANSDKSLGVLVQWLNNSGIKTSRNNFWNSNALSTMLKNPAFVQADASVYTYFQSKGVKFNNQVEDFVGIHGLYQYGCRFDKKTHQKKFKYQNMSEDIISLAPHTGLVSSETWLKVQLKLASNKAIGNGGKSVKSWLTGVCKCGYCGKAIIFCPTRDIVYISCLGRRDKHCYERKRTIRAEEIENIVEKSLLKHLKELPMKKEKEQKKNLPELNKLNMEIAKLEEEIERCVQTILKGGLLAERMEEEANKLLSQKQGLQAQITKLTVDNSKPCYGGFDIDDVIAQWPEMDVEQKKAVSKVFVKKVLVTDDNIDIEFTV